MAETIMRISINGQELARPFGNYPPEALLQGAVPEQFARSSSGMYVAETMLDQYATASEAITKEDGAEIDLGNLTTITQKGVQRFETRIKDGVMYDCFNLRIETPLSSLSTARIVGGDRSLPLEITLDEMALLMVLNSGLAPDQVKGVKATVIADKVHLYNRQQLLHFGLQVGDMVATLSSRNRFGFVYSYKERSRLFDTVSKDMFANNLRAQAGFPPLGN